MQGKAIPNCSDSDTAYLSVVLLTLGAPTYGFYDRLRIRRGQRCAWGTSEMLERFNFSPNNHTVYASGRRMLKPSLILLCIYPHMKLVISGVQAEEWAPLEMVVYSAWGDHGGPVWAGITSSSYDHMRSSAGCLIPSGRLHSVFRCLEARNNIRDGALRIYLAVALAVAAKPSAGVSACGG